jgi:3-dehydroquinate synthase
LSGKRRMKILRLHISAQSQNIPIFIGQILWKQLVEHLREHFSDHSIFVISDSNICSIYADKINRELASLAGFRGIIDFPAGEQSKNSLEKAKLEDWLLKNRAGSDTVVITMGGGVTGDLAGFVAATYFRGVPLIHVPTSLIAQVDSSIGGKVGINHPQGKNLIGAFYQPRAVFTDTDFLKTLPQEEFINGMAEVIKYAVVLDDDLWKLIEMSVEKILTNDPATILRIIERGIQSKIRVVEKDVNETGYRSILNFGHTVGHAIEKLSDFKIKHGFAIASGMIVAARLSQRLMGFPETLVSRLEKTLKLYHLDSVTLQDFPVDQIWESILSDKKVRQQSPRFTLLKDSSKPELFYPVRKEDLENVLNQ